jgi:protein O-mannosyl-transferase
VILDGLSMDQHSGYDPAAGGSDCLKVLAVSVLLLLAVALAFGRTCYCDFINLDDDLGVYKNPWVTQGFTADAVHWACTNRLVGNWDPLTWMTHVADWQIHGDRAGGHHLTNLLLHAAVTLLLFFVLRKMTASLWPSALATALWAVHPMRVESVAWVTERKDVLVGLFCVLTVLAYANYVSRRSWAGRSVGYAAVIVLFALGLLSKPALVTLPCLLLVLDYWPLKRIGPPWQLPVVVRLVVEKLPLLALAAACCGMTIWAQRVLEYPDRGAWWRIGNALIAYVVYLRQFFWPTGLALLYPRRPDALPAWQVLGAAAILLSITAATFACRRKCPYLLVGWLWYLGMLLPAVGFVPFGNEGPADRFTYLPQIGLCIGLAWGIADLCRWKPAWLWACRLASAAAIAVLIACAWQQTSYWRNSETLWTRSLACTSNNYCVHTLLGHALVERNQVDAGVAQFRKALAIKPDYSEANYGMGVAEAGYGHIDQAIAYYVRAITANRKNALAQNNLGHSLLFFGEYFEAIKHYEEALRFRPDLTEAHYNHGLALHALGHLRAAMEEYRESIRMRPDYPEAHFNLGLALEATGQRDEAIAHYNEAIRLKPDFVQPRKRLDVLLNNGRR